MMKNITAAITLLISQSLLADTGQRPDVQSVAAGKPLYEQYCLSCHKENGVGEKPIPPLIKEPGYLTAMPLNETSHAWHHGDEQLVATILSGLQRTQRMPAFKGTLTEQQASQIVAYIKSLWSDRIIACQGPKHMSCM
ncbi:c-type cytochrome [Sedimenticola selenatireducens]|uniref:c-type cytochrome n=1 Tax=Sedimenticola selenatireducens TaxID=191960 RepID=UPI0004BA75A1|nr:cytochrome c [Sedimenticola selenatireducens]